MLNGRLKLHLYSQHTCHLCSCSRHIENISYWWRVTNDDDLARAPSMWVIPIDLVRRHYFAVLRMLPQQNKLEM